MVGKRNGIAIALLVCICLTLFSGMALAEAATKLGIVDTKYGQAQGVEGEAFKDVTLFKGVPYAAPPVGDLRWAAPQEPESWEGVRVFDTYGDMAMQWTDGMETEPWLTDFYYEEFPNMSEDCLYLNIATPAVTGDEKLPVYVWIHGGGNKHGFAYEVECNPEALAAKGAVVVTVGHRLGVFGFMSLPEMDEETGYGASGNWIVQDIIKSLEWVKENIAGFGGDPDNITIGGQSGGTHKSAALFAGEYGKSLVNNVIWESGLKYDSKYSSVKSLQERSVEWLKMCGLTGEETLEELRAMDASVFMGTADIYGKAPMAFVNDGKFITYDLLSDAYADGMFEGVNVMVGSNFGENGYLDIPDTEAFYAYFKDLLGEELYNKYDFENLVKPTDEEAATVARTLAAYGLNARVGRNVMIDQLVGARFSELYPDQNWYVYLFSHIAPGRNSEYWWAWHSSELWYTFGSMRDIPEQRDWTEWDYQLSDTMMTYWVNFMRTGNPNGEGLPEWLPNTGEQMAYMNLGEPDTLGSVVADDTELSKLTEEWCRAKLEL